MSGRLTPYSSRTNRRRILHVLPLPPGASASLWPRPPSRPAPLWFGVDTGDSRQVPATQQCLNDAHLTVDQRADGFVEGYENDEWQCVGGTAIDLEVDMWEKEGNYDPFTFDPRSIGTRLHNDDEHIGRVHLEYPAAELALILDQPGESFTWDQHFQTHGHYTLTLRIQRIR